MCNVWKQRDQWLLQTTGSNPKNSNAETTTTNGSTTQEEQRTMRTSGKRKRDLPEILSFDEFIQKQMLEERRSMREKLGQGNRVLFHLHDKNHFSGTNKDRKQKVRDWVVDFSNFNGLEKYVGSSQVNQVSVDSSENSGSSSDDFRYHINGLDMKKSVFEYVGKILMPHYQMNKLSKESFKYIYKTTVEKVMEQNNELNIVVNASGFLETESKNKIQSLVYKFVSTFQEEQHLQLT